MAKPKTRRRVRMKLRLPNSHVRFYRRVARVAEVPLGDVIAVFMAVFVIKEKAKEKRRG